MRAIAVFIVVGGFASLPALTAAHHSFVAVYDSEQPVTVSGVVTRVEWLNPHAWFYIEAANDDGEAEEWGFELASPNGLMRLGWTRNSLSQGDEITAEGFLARDGSREVNTRSVTLADGRKLFTGDAVQGGLR